MFFCVLPTNLNNLSDILISFNHQLIRSAVNGDTDVSDIRSHRVIINTWRTWTFLSQQTKTDERVCSEWGRVGAALAAALYLHKADQNNVIAAVTAAAARLLHVTSKS